MMAKRSQTKHSILPPSSGLVVVSNLADRLVRPYTMMTHEVLWMRCGRVQLVGEVPLHAGTFVRTLSPRLFHLRGPVE